MNKLLSDVVEFHKTYGAPVVNQPTVPPNDRQVLRVELIREELEELQEAFDTKDIVAIADALTDLLYVVNGTVVECGLKDYIDACHEEVHASNMSKLGEDGLPIKREDGKVLKGPKFFEPDIKGILTGTKYVTFEELAVGQCFLYEGRKMMKTTERMGVSQDDERPKFRTYAVFKSNCSVKGLK